MSNGFASRNWPTGKETWVNALQVLVEVGAWAQGHTGLVLCLMLLPVVYVGVRSVARCYRTGRRG
jgi:hypothetical protein